jgi:UDP-N-acetylglucosamine 2-epimerase (non-hydrolysing)
LGNVILFIIGTRPEAIKLVPLILDLKKTNLFEIRVCTSGQHTEMLAQVLDLFAIEVNHSFIIRRKKHTLSEISEEILANVDPLICQLSPRYVVVHGDTSTTFASALAAFYNQCEVIHIEAGLRTGNKYSPWPEEINRRLTAVLTTLHFAPTELAKENLKSEGINRNSIYVVGNTVIDTLLLAREKITQENALNLSIRSQLADIDFDKKIILITAHRRENHGNGILNICKAIRKLSQHYSDVEFVFPVHLNPIIRTTVEQTLSELSNVHLLMPQTYINFVYLMMNAHIILTDSGGIQEEAPSLGCPVLLMRDTTERPEAVAAGTVKLVGSSEQSIYENVVRLINNKLEYQQMAAKNNPYGDGAASKKIVHILKEINHAKK